MKIYPFSRGRPPLCVEADGGDASLSDRSALAALFLERRELLRERLPEAGALLLRGLPPLEPEEFARFVADFSEGRLLDYAGGASPRVKLCEGVYTSTEYPRAISLSLHNELSYTRRSPALLFFHCTTPAATGGETPLADSRAILRKIDPRVAGRFRQKGVRYVRNLHGRAGDGYSWREAFETEDRAAVEAHCRAAGVQFFWRDDGGLRLIEVRPATATHPATGEEVWFNQAEGFHPSALDEESYRAQVSVMGEDGLRLNAAFGDGTPLDASDLDHIREVTRAEAVLAPWRAGDLLIVDNLLAAHGRMPFTGPRKVLLAMT